MSSEVRAQRAMRDDLLSICIRVHRVDNLQKTTLVNHLEGLDESSLIQLWQDISQSNPKQQAAIFDAILVHSGFNW